MKAHQGCAKTLWYWLKVVSFLLIPLAAVPILAGWIGDVAKDYLKGEKLKDAEPWLFWGALVALPLIAHVIISQGRKLLPARIIEQTLSFGQRRVVIALLSPCNNLERGEAGDWIVRDQKTKEEQSLSGYSLAQLTASNGTLPQWPWQQVLRAGAHHGARLEKLVLVGSLNGSGTDAQLDLARAFFETHFPGKVTIYGSPARPGEYDRRWQADFEDLSALMQLLRNILRELYRDDALYQDEDIVLDCTGGPKTASIAAALVTLDRPELMFQYVTTGKGDRIIGFNVATESSRQ